VLAPLATAPTWQDACQQSSVPTETFRSWLREPRFRLAVNKLYNDVDEAVRTPLRSLFPAVASMYEEALAAESSVTRTVTCRNCDEEIEVTVAIPAWSARLKAGDVLMKRAGEIVDSVQRVEVDHGGTVKHLTLTVEQELALMRWRRAMQTGEEARLSPAMMDELRRLGVIE